MMISPMRRVILAATACVLAVAVLHPLIAEALCVRGDEFLRSGDPRAAQRYFRFALFTDPNCATAAERFVFASLEIHTTATLKRGVTVADAYLRGHADQAVRTDRALALWGMKDFARAALELRAIGESTHDERYTRLAHIAARRAANGSRK
jgi:hypothetical protein